MRYRLPLVSYAIAALMLFSTASILAAAQKPKDAQFSGQVVDTVGATVAGAKVFVRRREPHEEDIKLLTHTDAKGNFTLALPEGGYDILITSPGFAASVKTIAFPSPKPGKFLWKLRALSCDFPGINCDTVQ